MSKIKRKNLVEEIKEESKTLIQKSDNIEKISTGITVLDLILGGGQPVGRMINIVGDKSTGKSYLASEILAHVRTVLGKKLKWFYDDCEGGSSFDTKEMYGFDVIKEEQKPSIAVEDFAANFNKCISKLKEDEYFIYVVDSWDGLSSAAERKRDEERNKAIASGKEYDKGTYSMEKQKFTSEFFRLRAGEIKNKKVILIVISQVRDNIGVMFGEKYRRNGGKALDFYSNIVLWLRESEKLKKRNKVIGISVEAKTKKAKIKTPFRQGHIDIIFDYGVDNIVSNINYLYDLKTDTGKEKKIKEIEWDGELFSGRNALVDHVEKHDLEEELAQRVVDKWNVFEKSISSEGRKNKWK